MMAPVGRRQQPAFVVNARKPEKAPQAVVTEEVLNYLWRSHKYQDEFRLAVNDWIVIGHGWVKMRLQVHQAARREEGRRRRAATRTTPATDVGIDDRDDVDGNVESEMYVYDDRPSSNASRSSTCSSTPMPATPRRCAGSPSAPGVRSRTSRSTSATRRRPARQVGATSWSRWSTRATATTDGWRQARQGAEVVLRDHRVLRPQAGTCPRSPSTPTTPGRPSPGS